MAPLQNQIKNISEGEQHTSEGDQPTSEGVHPPKQTSAETWYSQPRKKINIRHTQKRCPRRCSPHLHSIQADTSPAVVKQEHTLQALQTETTTQTPHQPMIVEEDPSMPAPTKNTSASFYIPIIITQDSLQAVTFDVMTQRPSAFTPSKMKQPLNEHLNLKH